MIILTKTYMINTNMDLICEFLFLFLNTYYEYHQEYPQVRGSFSIKNPTKKPFRRGIRIAALEQSFVSRWPYEAPKGDVAVFWGNRSLPFCSFFYVFFFFKCVFFVLINCY